MTIICYVYCIFVGLLNKVMELPAFTDYVQFPNDEFISIQIQYDYVVGFYAFKIVTRQALNNAINFQ